jgi:hypothetical protein
MARDHAVDWCLLVLAGAIGTGDETASALFRGQPPVAYNADEQRLSVLVQHELDRLIVGGCDQMVLLKVFPQREQSEAAMSVSDYGEHQAQIEQGQVMLHHIAWPNIHADAVRQDNLVRLAAEAINFFGPLHGGVVTQTAFSDVIVQGRRFTTTYPHINLERYDVYDARTSAPVLGAWRARRLQNQRRETRTNRMIDVALLALEVSQAVFPRLLG